MSDNDFDTKGIKYKTYKLNDPKPSKEWLEALDSTGTEYVRCTCLDRGRMALQKLGQHHCALQLKELQDEIDYITKYIKIDPTKPRLLLTRLFEYWDSYGKNSISFEEKD